MSFAISACNAGAVPLNGTCTMSMPAVCLKSSVVRCAAAPMRPKLSFGIGLRVRDELLHVLRRQVVVRGEDERRDAGERDRHQVLARIEGQLALVERDVGRVAGDHRRHGVAIGRRLCGQIGAEDAVRARAVIHHDRLAKRSGHFLRDHSRHHIGDATARVRHDPADRLVRIGLRETVRGRRSGGRRAFSYVTGSFYGGMLREKSFVHFEPEPGLLQRPDVAVAVHYPGFSVSSSRKRFDFETSPSK